VTLPISPPLEPMLAKLQSEMPEGDGWRYEPKWDGFRAIVFRDRGRVHIGSRGRRPLHRYFPELLDPLQRAFKVPCVVDGEIVVATKGHLDFDALQLRLHPADSRVRMLAKQTPATFVAFDLLAEGSTDLRERPLSERFARLERLMGKAQTAKRAMRTILAPATSIVLTPWTADPREARVWFDQFESAGLDGLIAKRDELTYQPGKRAMTKVKHRRTIECVVGGYRLAKDGDGVGSLLLGLYNRDGVLHFVGHTSSFSAAQRRELLLRMKPMHGGESFGEGRAPGGPSRWTQAEKEWTPVEPSLVCEVSYDQFQSGVRFRHAATFLRWRPDRDPSDCLFPDED
jgi:ATP-dependent DNA ligase